MQPRCPECGVTMHDHTNGYECPECGILLDETTERAAIVIPPEFDGPSIHGA